MGNIITNKTKTIFEQIRREDENGNEYWSSRELSEVLGYSVYRNFKPVIEKAKESCKNSNHNIIDNFAEMRNMVELGSGAKRQIENVKLSRKVISGRILKKSKARLSMIEIEVSHKSGRLISVVPNLGTTEK